MDGEISLMNVWMMVPGFLILTGVALLFVHGLKVRFGEGIFLGVSAIMAFLFLGGLFHFFLFGMVAAAGLGIAGLVIDVACGIRGRSFGKAWNVPSFWVLAFVLLYGILLFHGAVLQHIDEFHMWAAVLKQMSQENRLPDWAALGVSPQMYAGTFFQLFFQKFTGYSEQAMYASSYLMMWIGFLLPYASAGKKQKKTVLLYSLIVFLSIYSFYFYPYKTLYVDLPTVAWAGGLCGWWTMREEDRKLQNRIVLAVGLLTLVLLKSYVGILMAVLTLCWILMEKAAASGRMEERRFRVRTGVRLMILMALVFGVCGGVMLMILKGHIPAFFPESVRNLMGGAGITPNKAARTLGALGNAFLGTRLTSLSDLPIQPFAFLVFLAAWSVVEGWLYGEERASQARIGWGICATALYLLFLAMSYLCLFTYEEAVKVAGVKRYFTIFLMTQMLIVLVRWLRGMDSSDKVRRRIAAAGGLALLVFFSIGINDKFISSATGFNRSQISGNADIEETNREAEQVEQTVGEGKVYFLNQDDENEFPQNIAFYRLGDQVSNYLNTPWRFTEDGGEIRIQEYETPTIQDFPQILAAQEYEYVWIYQADSYLAGQLGQIFDMDLSPDQITDGQLYRVDYEAGAAEGLTLVRQLDKDAQPVLKLSQAG